MKIIGSLTEKMSTRQLAGAMHATGTAVIAVILAVGYTTGYSSVESNEAEWIDTIHENQSLLQRSQQIEDERNLTECELFALTRRLEELNALIPDTRDESSFLAQLAALADEADLDIQNFRPGPAEDSHNLKRIRVQLTGAGSYECICTFLDGLQALPRLTHVSRMKIDPLNATNQYPVEMELSIFFAADSGERPVRTASR